MTGTTSHDDQISGYARDVGPITPYVDDAIYHWLPYLYATMQGADITITDEHVWFTYNVLSDLGTDGVVPPTVPHRDGIEYE